MATNETGNAKNVANFEDLISFCAGYGATFNPSKASIKLPALNTQLTASRSSLTAVNNALPAYNNATAARETAFDPLSKLITRVTNAVAASGAAPNVVADIKTITKKLQGRRAAPAKKVVAKGTDTPTDPSNPTEPTEKTISASQLSFDSRIENLEKLNQQLAAITLYAPNEADLKVTALNALLTDLKAKNTAVVAATTPLSNARINRNKTLYDPTTGLVTAAAEVKMYVKSLFGASSPQYKQISGIKFTKPKGV
jgi:hypothetical protein